MGTLVDIFPSQPTRSNAFLLVIELKSVLSSALSLMGVRFRVCVLVLLILLPRREQSRTGICSVFVACSSAWYLQVLGKNDLDEQTLQHHLHLQCLGNALG